jgi:hypothetical protein
MGSDSEECIRQEVEEHARKNQEERELLNEYLCDYPGCTNIASR